MKYTIEGYVASQQNVDRAIWAEKAINTFRHETGTDPEDAICDLLGDLMHYAAQNGYDFEHELERGRWHFEAELGGEG